MRAKGGRGKRSLARPELGVRECDAFEAGLALRTPGIQRLLAFDPCATRSVQESLQLARRRIGLVRAFAPRVDVQVVQLQHGAGLRVCWCNVRALRRRFARSGHQHGGVQTQLRPMHSCPVLVQAVDVAARGFELVQRRRRIVVLQQVDPAAQLQPIACVLEAVRHLHFRAAAEALRKCLVRRHALRWQYGSVVHEVQIACSEQGFGHPSHVDAQ